MNANAAEPQGWRPTEGDVLTGTVVDLDAAWSDYTQSNYPIVNVKREGTEEVVSVHCFHFVLRKQMMSKQPRPGDRIIIAHKGKTRTKDDKREVTLYSVELPDRAQDAGAFWKGMGAPTGTSSASAGTAEVPPDVEIDDSDIPF